ncbi:hypothetical protein QFC19_005334 [Naganishia cerealis]|uniref:Uncharacterized protein n=1 Tax=Naganishia cerealis TaxID=610337 RepID=A0ACC2VPC6_9TREE|nr:hypothetical protein QFC19_005334 [Naganishia cerealis]
MTVFVRFFSIETYLEAFLPHIRLNKHFIDPTCVRIEGIPAGGRKLFDKLCAFAQKKWGMIHDTKFKDKPDGCDCYIRLRLPTIADDMRQYNWRDPDAPPEFFDIITSTPVYALWGSGGKPPGAFVDKDLQPLAMQHLDNPTYQQAFGIEAHGMAGNQVPLPMMGNATPFPNMGNATPFPSMTGNATPFNSMGGNATSWNPISSYAATPFHSFSLDNAGSTSNDPRFPAPQMIEDMPPQSDMMVDQGFSRRANANNRPGSTKSRDGNDATDLSAVDQEVDALETSSQKSSYSRSSSKGSSKKRPRSLSRTSRDHRKMSTSDKSIRMQQIFPVESEDADIDILRKAQESAIVWNKPENMEKLHAYEAIFDHYVEKIVAARKAKYAALNEMREEDDPTEEVTTTEAIPSVIPEQT